MERRCCVCNKYLGEKPGPKDAVSHGFCDPCLEEYKANIMAEMDELDKKTAVPAGVVPDNSETFEVAV